MRRWGTGIAVGVLFALGTAFGPPGAGAALGQAGEPTIVVEQAQPLLAAYDYTVRVVGADGASVNGAAVTGTPVSPDGFVGHITTLEPLDQDGRYRGVVEMPAPGSWTVRFAVADPVANLEHAQEMGLSGVGTPTETPVTEPPLAEEPPPADEGAQVGDAEPPVGDAPETAPSVGSGDGGSSSKTVPVLLAVAAVVMVVAFGAAVVVLRRRREVADALDAVQKEDPLHGLAHSDDSDDDATVVVDDADYNDDQDSDDARTTVDDQDDGLDPVDAGVDAETASSDSATTRS